MNGFVKQSAELQVTPQWPREVRDESVESARICRCRSGRRRRAGGGFLSAARRTLEPESFFSECLSADHAGQQDHNRGSALGDGARCTHRVAYDFGGGKK